MKHIGIMGGTFNPVHYAHLILAEAASEEYSFDETWFIPSKHPPYKSNECIVSDEHRVAMLELALADNSNFHISDIELKRGGLTYTVETLISLHKLYPDYSFSFIIGGDSIMQFETWYKPDQICKLCHVIAAGRSGYTKEDIKKQCEHVKEIFNADVEYLDIPAMEISSSFLRERIKNGQSVRYYMPDNVISYIKENKLYY